MQANSRIVASAMVAVGGFGVLLAWGLFLPSQCGNTDMVVTEPDLNHYECSSLLIRDQDIVRGPTPGTSPTHTGMDYLQTRMLLRALTTSVAPLVVAGAGLFWLRRGQPLIGGPRSKTAGIMYVVAAGAAAGASVQAASGVLNSGAALIPLLFIPVVVPLVRFLAEKEQMWVGWSALVVQIVLVIPIALPIGFMYIPSALILLGGLITEGVSRSTDSKTT